jgi:HAD superfamily hydrolase (TIGR01549 family)
VHLKRIRAVTFDFFQTLVHHDLGDGGRGNALVRYLRSKGMAPAPWRHELLYRIMETHGREYEPACSEMLKEAYFARLTQRVFECLELERHSGEANQHARSIWEIVGPASLKLYADVVPVLTTLQAGGYRLAVISNFHCGLGHFCTELGVGDRFETVVASAEVGHAKPEREIFELASSKLGIPPDQILHVGDSLVDDVEGSGTAGFNAIWLDRSGQGEHRPRIQSLSDLFEVLVLDRQV